MSYHYVSALVLLLCQFRYSSSLFPRETESREVKVLNGLWNFRVDNSSSRDAGFTDEWFKKSLKKTGETQKMPVPSSYNDITTDASIRDFIGWVWYDREVFVPERWDDEDNLRVVLRFESCSYFCVVYVNGEKMMSHDGGHLPFEAEVTETLKYGGSNLITVAVNNTLTPKTLPPGSIEYMNDTRKYPEGYFVQNLQMDFFNYAGIHRPVKLYVTPTAFLLDISLGTLFEGSTGILNFKSSVAAMEGDSGDAKSEDIKMKYTILDADANKKADVEGVNLFKGSLNVTDVNLWWPVDMGQIPGYLYTLIITTHSSGNNLTDVYRIRFGFRTVKVDGTDFLINGKPFYFKGFGMHEDAEIRGKGLDLPTIVRDFNLIKWIGGNSFRTSHYPYADEIMDIADENGIVVIDESPGVGIQRENMGEENINKHKEVMKEFVHRDKNHPCVVMWSVANEPETQYEEAETYFKAVIQYTRELDSTRPVTFVGNQSPYDDKAVKFNDVICYNKYYSWYHDSGHLEVISYQLEKDLILWRSIYDKPFIMTEYGADAVAGLHELPVVMFTEGYQVEAMKGYYPVFNKYRGRNLIGEMIWNFADFNTAQDITRVVGNKKGMFTRQRQPKYSAYILRERYQGLSSLIQGVASTNSNSNNNNNNNNMNNFQENTASLKNLVAGSKKRYGYHHRHHPDAIEV